MCKERWKSWIKVYATEPGRTGPEERDGLLLRNVLGKYYRGDTPRLF
jgi:hypothetical protein